MVKPVTEQPGESNLLVVTTSGRQLSFLLRMDPSGPKRVDFVLVYKPADSFLVGEIIANVGCGRQNRRSQTRLWSRDSEGC